MAKARKTVDTDDLTIIIKSGMFGLTHHYELIRHYGTKTGEETLAKSGNDLHAPEIETKARELAAKLNIPVYVQR